jgi:hypothetical protein
MNIVSQSLNRVTAQTENEQKTTLLFTFSYFLLPPLYIACIVGQNIFISDCELAQGADQSQRKDKEASSLVMGVMASLELKR